MPYNELQPYRILSGTFKTATFAVPRSSLPTPGDKYVAAQFVVPSSSAAAGAATAGLSGELQASRFIHPPFFTMGAGRGVRSHGFPARYGGRSSLTGLGSITEFIEQNGKWLALGAAALLLFGGIGGRRRR